MMEAFLWLPVLDEFRNWLYQSESNKLLKEFTSV